MKNSTPHKGLYRLVMAAIIVAGVFFVHQSIANKKSDRPSVTASSSATPAPNVGQGTHEAVSSSTKITVVATTNRKNSLSAQVAKYYVELLKKKGCETQLLTLTDLPANFTSTALYENFGKNAAFNRLKEVMEASEKYVFIVPEYNGSFPGVFKAFIDGLEFPATFIGKKCAMVGVSAGPQGSVFAMSHLTDIFHMAHMNVYPLKPRLANIHDSQLTTVLANEVYVRQLENQIEGFIKY